MFVIHLGFSGFPKGNASVQRVRLTFKGLKEAGINPLVINKISHHARGTEKRINRFEGIAYLNTARLVYKPNSFLARNINKVSGYLGELIFFIRKRKTIDTAILYSNYFLELPYYWMLSRVFGFKIVLQYVEFFSAIPGRSSLFTKLNDRLLDQQFYHFCDGVIAISDFLVYHVQKKALQLPLIKLPAICDFSEFENIPAFQDLEGKPYLMYCGSIYYLEVIELLVGIFDKLKKNNQYEGKLVLVVSGDHGDNHNRLQSLVDGIGCQEDLVLKSNIPYAHLLALYKGADMLLIPLRDTVQDNARFPHKIGEYTASQRPILSTNVGELKYYFKDGVSAVLADEYSETAYLEKLGTVLSSREILNEIGQRGNQVGLTNFNYQQQGIQLSKFLSKVNNKPA